MYLLLRISIANRMSFPFCMCMCSCVCVYIRFTYIIYCLLNLKTFCYTKDAKSRSSNNAEREKDKWKKEISFLLKIIGSFVVQGSVQYVYKWNKHTAQRHTQHTIQTGNKKNAINNWIRIFLKNYQELLLILLLLVSGLLFIVRCDEGVRASEKKTCGNKIYSSFFAYEKWCFQFNHW